MNIFAPEYEFESIGSIDSDFFKRENIRFLLLDIDNTLIGDNVPEPDESSIAFLKRLEDEGIEFYLVSNNKKDRVDSFNKQFNYRAIYRASKPFARKLNRVMKEMNAKKEQTALIGDQIFTDVLAAKNARIRMILVSPINKDLENNFFKLKRMFEKLVYKRKFLK